MNPAADIDLEKRCHNKVEKHRCGGESVERPDPGAVHHLQREDEQTNQENPKRGCPTLAEKVVCCNCGMRRIGYTGITQKGEQETRRRGHNTAKEPEEKMGETRKHEGQAKTNKSQKDAVNKSERESHSILDFVSFH